MPELMTERTGMLLAARVGALIARIDMLIVEQRLGERRQEAVHGHATPAAPAAGLERHTTGPEVRG